MKSTSRKVVLVISALFATGGVVSGIIYGYDALPDRYGGGDTHALFAFLCAAVLVLGGIVLFLGIVFMMSFFRSRVFYVGSALVIISSVWLIFFGVQTLRNRHFGLKVEDCTQKNTDELLLLVSQDKAIGAVKELGRRKEKRAVPLLCEILDDPKQNVDLRIFSALALGDISDTRAIESLRRALLDKHIHVKAAADSALFLISEAEKTPPDK